MQLWLKEIVKLSDNKTNHKLTISYCDVLREKVIADKLDAIKTGSLCNVRKMIINKDVRRITCGSSSKKTYETSSCYAFSFFASVIRVLFASDDYSVHKRKMEGTDNYMWS